MHIRTPTIVALLSGIFAGTGAAQELVTFTWTFGEVFAETTVPVANPDGFVGPGEGAELRLRISFTPDVGQPITYTPPPPPGTGTVGGIGALFFEFDGGPSAHGSFRFGRHAFGGFHGPSGTVNPTSTGMNLVQAGQIAFPETPLNNPNNPIENAYRIVWTPSDHTPRIVTFTFAKSVASTGTGASIYIRYGGTPQEPLWTSKQLPADFGSVQIPVIPSPATLLVLGSIAALRRRRR